MGALPKKNLISNNCKNRVKPSLLRDVKTEAVLVFARTALERYFKEQKENTKFLTSTNKDVSYVYNTLKNLLTHLQECVVNVDYLLHLSHAANKYPQLHALAKYEEPLIEYYNIMSQQVQNFYKGSTLYLPEFLLICVLAEWIHGEEKSTYLYPFLDTIDFFELMGKFEVNRECFYIDNECKISEIHEVAFRVVEKLKNYKYKLNKNRSSKNKRKV